jgi:hypothetical protein
MIIRRLTDSQLVEPDTEIAIARAGLAGALANISAS